MFHIIFNNPCVSGYISMFEETPSNNSFPTSHAYAIVDPEWNVADIFVERSAKVSVVSGGTVSRSWRRAGSGRHVLHRRCLAICGGQQSQRYYFFRVVYSGSQFGISSILLCILEFFHPCRLKSMQ